MLCLGCLGVGFKGACVLRLFVLLPFSDVRVSFDSISQVS